MSGPTTFTRTADCLPILRTAAQRKNAFARGARGGCKLKGSRSLRHQRVRNHQSRCVATQVKLIGLLGQLLLEHDGTDVDLQDRLDGNTPLHWAVQLSHPEARAWTVRSLLEAGAHGIH